MAETTWPPPFTYMSWYLSTMAICSYVAKPAWVKRGGWGGPATATKITTWFVNTDREVVLSIRQINQNIGYKEEIKTTHHHTPHPHYLPLSWTCFPLLSWITLYISPLSPTINFIFFWGRREINHSLILSKPLGNTDLEITTEKTTIRTCSKQSISRVPKFD